MESKAITVTDPQTGEVLLTTDSACSAGQLAARRAKALGTPIRVEGLGPIRTYEPERIGRKSSTRAYRILCACGALMAPNSRQCNACRIAGLRKR